MNKFLQQFCLLLFLCGTAFAQTRQVTGQVTEKGTSDGIPSVTVLVKGASGGTQSDVNGNYKITVPDGAVTLVFRSVGYKTLEVKVAAGATKANAGLETDATQLNEVAVVNIGYGTVSRNAVTGSVSSVSAKQLKDLPINSASEALEGRLAGVQINQSEGSPNTTATIKVRGGGSIRLDNAPLYVVDGIQVEDALTVLAPQDIETIDVLKDAASTAIYGARGSNGVVLITTKGGRVQKPTVTYNGLAGWRHIRRKLDVFNTYDFVKYQYERALLNGGTELSTFTSAYGAFADLDLYKEAPFVDWQDEMFGRNALMQTHNLSLTGGTESTKYNLSISSNGEQGIQQLSDYNRKIINFKLNQKINDKLMADFAVRYNNTIVNGAGTSDPGSSSSNRLRQVIRYKPILTGGKDLLDYDPDYALQTNANSLSLVNPLLLNQAEYRKNYNSTANFSVSLAYNPIKMLTLRSTLGYDLINNRMNAFNDTITSVARQNSNQPTASINTLNRYTLDNANTITFDMNKSGSRFSKRNNLTILLGEELYQNIARNYGTSALLFPIGISANSAINNFSLGTVPVGGATSSEATNRVFSLFGRINYSFDNKYLINISMRSDGSSLFANGYKWGDFPATSFAWRISEEKFFSKLKNTFDDLKFRINYGKAGNNRVDPFLYLTQFNANSGGNTYSQNDVNVVGYQPNALAFNSLTWETTTSKGLGLDFAILKNRLQVTADVYDNSITNLLLQNQLGTQTGYGEQLRNSGATSNKGFELQINATPISTKKFTWTANFNLSHNDNKIVSLGGISTSRLYSSGWAGGNQPSDYLTQVGQPVGVIWGLQSDGFYTIDDFNYASGVYTLKSGVANNQSVTSTPPQPGVIKYKDLNGDGVVDDKDRTNLGSTQAKIYGGLNQQFRYGDFDFSVFVNFQYGNKVLNANKLEFSSGYTPNANLLSVMEGRWRNVNDQGVRVTDPTALAALNANATIWSPLTTASSFYVNSWAVEDGSFLRLSNVTLGYTIPKSLLSRVKVSNLRIYGTVNNAAVWTKYSGFDPEVNTRRSSPVTPGVDYSAYPRSTAFIFGVNLTL
ncbi:TonB-dependent receptor [Mucilaginibacter mali]|uniref:TonB-dependent receptor n=1 Tax=Mucilaginibacter mali TaxID=2740462 RepID=A0A7D4Q082_9SPHI|nr:TonB-dependent receptor [Mucilaginibacter mali]QKJ29566.1 TonB-dependent receptor [Mucilaginibacter mali]